MQRWGLLLGPLILAVFIVACQPQPVQVFIEVDGGRQALNTEATTVREALNESQIELSPLDRVDPDLYARLEPGLVIVVTRVTEEMQTRREVIPFERQTIANEALATGETRLAQLGVSGEDEISIRVVYEDGLEVNRTEISRKTVIEPVPEILVVGPQGELPSVPVAGTVAYMANGNAWLMRNSSGSRRALTTEGDLDGRVFALSPDGRQLTYTTKLTDEIELPLNELWSVSTTIVGERPMSLGISDVLQAEWSPVISQSLLAYTTAERTANPPGWLAHNDLWLLDLSKSRPTPEALLPANTQGLYAWWGTTFTWSPDGTKVAYARADQIGVMDLEASRPISDSIVPLIDFAPLKTFSEWVWVPDISWSPNGRFIAATVHGPPLASESAEESQVFDLWLISLDGTLSTKVAEQTGMWANPAWGEAGIAFGEALEPLQSVTSRYSIQLIDHDGSNKQQIFPFKEELGVNLPELAWSPDSSDLLFIYNGNLYLTSSIGNPPRQLTSDGQASQPRWVSQAPVITNVSGITGSASITDSGIITTTIRVTPTATLSATPALSATSDTASSGGNSTTKSIPGATGTAAPAVSPIPSPSSAEPGQRAPIQATDPVSRPTTSDLEENKGSPNGE